jgi:DNA-binding GntR family transcriptional regulator
MPSEDGHVLPRVVPRTYRSDVYQGLRQAILEGTLPPGAPLVERRISEEMGVSRAPVREALRQLEDEGLVVTIPYKGTYVTRVTPEVMDEILSLRTVLEVYALERALPRLKSEGVEPLRELIGEMERAGESDDPERLDELHNQFHRTLYERAGNGLLLQFWASMESQLRLYSRVHQRAYTTLREYASAHRSLVEALESGDLGKARQRVLEHLGEKTAGLLSRSRDA